MAQIGTFTAKDGAFSRAPCLVRIMGASREHVPALIGSVPRELCRVMVS